MLLGASSWRMHRRYYSGGMGLPSCPRPDQWPENQDVSNMVVDDDSFELATAQATTTLVHAPAHDGFTVLINTAHSLYTLSKRFG